MIKLARFFVSEEQIHEGKVTITQDDAHHITRVLRLKPGDTIECVDPQGQVHLVRIEELGSTVLGRVEESWEGLQEPPLHLILFQGLAKGDKLDWVVQKAVELGAAEVVPFTSRYTVVKLEPKQAQKRKERWERIAVEAAKQCGRTHLPRVHPVRSFAELTAEVRRLVERDALVVLAYEGEGQRGLGDLEGNPQTVAAIVGPEGGFSPEEVEELAKAGAQVCTLGPRILRTETAGLVLLSVLGYKWGDLA